MKKKILALGLVAAMTMSLFAACGSSAEESAPAEDTSAEATTEEAAPAEATADAAVTTVNEGVLTMATNASFPPYEYVEGTDYAGIDVEIATAIAEKLGLTLQVEDIDFGAIIAGVQTGKYDMGMAGMTVTDERKESVNFSDTYATGVQSIIVPEGSDIQSVDDLVAGETKVGVQQDTTGDIYASDDGYVVTEYKTGNDAVAALVAGKVDCVIIDNEPAKSYVASNEGLTVLDTAYVEEDYAICTAKENTALLEAINNALAELKADGTIDSILAKYISAE